MRMDTTESTLLYQTSEVAPEELTFDIREQDVSHVIMLLRQKLYKQPIEAICREVSCNARDANREVGKSNIPIVISINMNPLLGDSACYTVEDCGPGISPSRMSNVFIAYGASTKRDSDEQTGGFGLGAKTPFAYTSQFLIETCAEGVQYTYMAVIAKGSRGRVIKLREEPIEGEPPYGTRITIPILKDDREEFEEKTYKSTLLWDVPPVFQGFEQLREIQDIVVSPSMGIPGIRVYTERTRANHVNFLSNREKVGVLLDGIPYPLEDSVIPRDTLTEAFENVSYIFFEVLPGQVSLTPSREGLHYDDKTRKFFQDKLAAIEEYLHTFSSGLLARLPRKLDLLGFIKVNPDKWSSSQIASIPEEYTQVPRKDIYRLLTLESHLKGSPYYYLGDKDLVGALHRLQYCDVSCEGPQKIHTCRCDDIRLLGASCVIVHDTSSLTPRNNMAWNEYLRENKHLCSTMMVRLPRGKGFNKKKLDSFPGDKIVETLAAVGIHAQLYSSRKSLAQVTARPKTFRKNCSIFRVVDGGSRVVSYEARVENQEGEWLIYTAAGAPPLKTYDGVLLFMKSSENLGKYLREIYLVRALRGEPAEKIIAICPNDVSSRHWSKVTWRQIGEYQFSKGEASRIQKVFDRIHVVKRFAQNSWAKFLVDRKFPKHCLISHFSKELGKHLRVSIPEKDIALYEKALNARMLTLSENAERMREHVDVLLRDARVQVARHPLGGAIMHSSTDLGNEEFCSALEKFIKRNVVKGEVSDVYKA